MKVIATILLVVIGEFSIAQSRDSFLPAFLLGDTLRSENVIDKYSVPDFSPLWLQTDNYNVVGIIGDHNQRIKIKLLTINKDPNNREEYHVTGKSSVKGNICDFEGTIRIEKILEVEVIHLGVDNEYKDRGIKSQGVLVAQYEFFEKREQKHSGIFKGTLYTKWYIDANSEMRYDDIQNNADRYMNNAFLGTWQMYVIRS